jgi:hypothetical protein
MESRKFFPELIIIGICHTATIQDPAFKREIMELVNTNAL